MPAPQTRLGGVFTEKGNLVRLPKGRLLQSRGELSERLYYLVKGHVLLHLSSLVGKELTLDVFGPGELIGIGALSTESAHYLNATTLSECVLRCLSAQTLKSELMHNAELCLELFNWTNNRLAKYASHVEELGLCRLAPRIARHIINHFRVQGVPLKNGSEASIGSQKLLANMVAGTRESINKELRRLQEMKVIEVSGQSVRLLDASKLKQQAETDSTTVS